MQRDHHRNHGYLDKSAGYAAHTSLFNAGYDDGFANCVKVPFCEPGPNGLLMTTTVISNVRQDKKTKVCVH